jgi:hypothetical protein
VATGTSGPAAPRGGGAASPHGLRRARRLEDLQFVLEDEGADHEILPSTSVNTTFTYPGHTCDQDEGKGAAMSRQSCVSGRRSQRWLAPATSALRWADRYTLWAFGPPRPLSRLTHPPSSGPHTAETTGSKSGSSAVGLVTDLVAQERERANSWQDPVRTLREVDLLATRLSASVADLRSHLPGAVRTLRRRGWSFDQIAAQSGLPIARVIKLARESRTRGL